MQGQGISLVLARAFWLRHSMQYTIMVRMHGEEEEGAEDFTHHYRGPGRFRLLLFVISACHRSGWDAPILSNSGSPSDPEGLDSTFVI